MSSLFFCLLGLLACGGSSDDPLEPDTPVVPDKPTEVVLTVSPATLEVPAIGGNAEVKVTTTGESWSARTSDAWVTLVTENSGTEGVIKLAISPNTDAERYGSIAVTSGSKSEYIQVKQLEALRLSAAEVYCTSGTGSATATVYGSDDWEAAADQDWVSVKREGTELQMAYTANTEQASRTATVTVTGAGQERSLSLIQESAESVAITAPEGYSLVWYDEFNEGTELDKAHWTHEVQSAGWVNNELQNYVNGAYNGRRVTELSDGKLRIHCFKEGGNVYSGRVYAHVDEGWQYGYIEARIMLPKGKGTWPAFWMMPVTVDWANEGWPKCGEIDIMEEVGVVPNEVSSSLHAEGHNHTNNTQVTKAKKIEKAEGEFHTYAIEWTEQNITTYVDGEVLLSYDNDGQGVRNWPYDKPYYIILNLAWGGSWGGMNGVDETALPVSYVIDYVRVFQKK